MNDYTILLWLHITFAVLWVGGGVMLTILGLLVQRSRDTQEMTFLIKRVSFLSERYLAPVSGITALWGFILVITQDQFAFSEPWIGTGILLWIVSGATGGMYLGPRSARALEAIQRDGTITAATQAIIDRILLVARIDSVVLLVVIFLMTVKPGEA